MNRPLPHADFIQLKGWNRSTIYNRLEQITRHDIAQTGFKTEETRDFMPHLGPMVGRAVTVVCEPSNPRAPARQSQSVERVSPLRR